MEIIGDASHELSPEQFARFPGHGWAADVNGIRTLWFPINTVLCEISKIRRKAKLPEDLPDWHARAVESYFGNLSKLAVTLRELARVSRGAHPAGDQWFWVEEPFVLGPLFFDLAFVYLRRLSDRLARAVGPALFRHIGSLPRTFQDVFRDPRKMKRPERSGLIVEQDAFRSLITESTGWFERLRSRPLGVRDVLEHDDVEILICVVSDFQDWKIIGRTSTGLTIDELTHVIGEICRGFCAFLTALHHTIGYGKWYRTGDNLNVPLGDTSTSLFWPPI